MTHTIQIESARELPSGALSRALASCGVDGPMEQTGSLFSLGALGESLEHVAARVSRALDTLLAELPFPLVPERIGPSSFYLHPPAG